MSTIEQIITKFHYSKKFNITNVFLFVMLAVPSVFYAFIINFKNLLYNLNIKKEKTPTGNLKNKNTNPKIICIGNLTTGGVGKTPIVIEFAKYLSKSKNTVVLSRGYRGKLNGANVIRDYYSLLMDDTEQTGDEVRLIADNSPTDKGYAVITSKDRLQGANKAIDELDAEIIIMDDGFSNRKMKKDLTLLLFDTKKITGNGFLLPLGPLREPKNEVKRADGIIIIDKENFADETIDKIAENFKKAYNKPVFTSKFCTDGYYDLLTKENITPDKNAKVIAFSGIGQPFQFYKLVKKDFDLVETITYDDHHCYGENDIEKILSLKEKWGAKYVLTTEKDAVKMTGWIYDKGFGALKLKADLKAEEILKTFNF